MFVVDDDEPVLASIQLLLQSQDLPVAAFASARSFLDAVSADSTGCLVLDLQMPDISGPDLLEELRRRKIQLETVVITGFTAEEFPPQLLSLNPDQILQKPFSAEQLLTVVRRMFAKFSGAADAGGHS